MHRTSPALSALLLLAPLAATAQVTPALQQATVSVASPAPQTPVSGRVWLTLPGQDALQQAVAAIYNPASPGYHQFLSWSSLAPWLPTAAQLQAVQARLAAAGLTITSTDPHNLSVAFTGSTAAFEAAFQTTVQQRTLRSGVIATSLSAAPSLTGAPGLIRAVSGIGQVADQPDIDQPHDPVTGKLLGVESMQQAAAQSTTPGPYYCLFNPAAALLSTPGQLVPDAAYYGPLYSAPVTGGRLTSAGACGYTPAQFDYQTGLDRIHAAGYTGAGQTIAILEQIGSPTITSDLEAFDTLYGLPQADLQIIDLTNNPGPSSAFVETTLDVESAHATAPAAKIIVIDVNPGYLIDGLTYVVNHNLADVVSMSYGSTELTDNPGNIAAWNEEAMLASSMHIAFNVSSGDYGDRIADEGVADVNVPADSPYVTGVGGLSIAYIPGTQYLYKTSWGRDTTQIGSEGVPYLTPQPIPHGQSKFGSGGGVSRIFPVPGYQAALGGSGRHVPDVSDIADGRTGLKIVVTDPANCTENPCSEIAGGTSLAAPVFSAKWALLDQLYGFPLGEAAPFIAQSANTPAVQDIVPQAGVTVSGAGLSAAGFHLYSANALGNPETSQPYVSALWQDETGGDYVLTFGTDSSLAVTPGYDAATGWGQLDVQAIFAALVPSTQP